jgi:hypothetical protein
VKRSRIAAAQPFHETQQAAALYKYRSGGHLYAEAHSAKAEARPYKKMPLTNPALLIKSNAKGGFI